jgi:putative serine protease PepD
MFLVGAAAALAAVVWAVILFSPASDRPTSPGGKGTLTDAPYSTLAGQANALPSSADAASHSLVELQAATSHGEVTMIGVAVAEGGLVATTADGLVGLRTLDMVGADGSLHRASVVAIDRTSDVALVNVPDDVPVPPFADDAALSAGSADMTLSMSAPGTSTALRCTPGTVTAVGTAITAGPAEGMPAIVSSAAAVTQVELPGDPLLNSSGDVVGLLYRDDGTGAPSYLPTQLVLGVADDLRSSGRVAHGWLGVDGSASGTAGGPAGALVTSVVPGSPAAGRLQAGELIVALGSLPIRSMAELRARLYVLAPATRVDVSVRDGATTRVVDVTLSASP